jgi:hypothetical protein
MIPQCRCRPVEEQADAGYQRAAVTRVFRRDLDHSTPAKTYEAKAEARTWVFVVREGEPAALVLGQRLFAFVART